MRIKIADRFLVPAVLFLVVYADNAFALREAVSLQEKQKKYLQGGCIENVTFPVCQEGQKGTLTRHGLLFSRPGAKATVLVCHGFMCQKFDIGFIRPLLFPDYNVFLFDFRAHGENVSEEQCCTFGRDEAFDVVGAADYLKSRPDIGKLPLIIYGFSMGAVAAILAQAKHPDLCKALIVDCPYDDSRNVIKRSIENLKFNLFGYTFDMPGRGLLEKFAFNRYVQSCLKALLKTISHLDATTTNTYIYPVSPAESVATISVPCFFIHCAYDEKVSVTAAKVLFANAQGYKRLWITQGRRHFDSILYNPEKYIYKVNTFIEDVLTGATTTKERAKTHDDTPKNS